MKSIGTHNGKFHCDEVFACYMLKKLPEFQNHVVLRTRDKAILESCDVIVDVGGIYDPVKKRFDHHQRDFNHTMNTLLQMDYHTKLSSAGLIYAHYGKEVIAEILQINLSDFSIPILYEKLYQCFVEYVDAVDNGINQFDGKPRYQLASTLNSRVCSLNPAWNDKEILPEKQFQKAMIIVGEEFEDRVKYLYNSWLPARDYVFIAIQKRKDIHPSGKIIELGLTSLPWKDHFFNIEKCLNLQNENICLIIYADNANDSWRVQAIPVSETSTFDNRISLPWKGLRDSELEKESNIEGAIFVHASGFIGGAKTKSGALKMAIETLKKANLI